MTSNTHLSHSGTQTSSLQYTFPDALRSPVGVFITWMQGHLPSPMRHEPVGWHSWRKITGLFSGKPMKTSLNVAVWSTACSWTGCNSFPFREADCSLCWWLHTNEAAINNANKPAEGCRDSQMCKTQVRQIFLTREQGDLARQWQHNMYCLRGEKPWMHKSMYSMFGFFSLWEDLLMLWLLLHYELQRNKGRLSSLDLDTLIWTSSVLCSVHHSSGSSPGWTQSRGMLGCCTPMWSRCGSTQTAEAARPRTAWAAQSSPSSPCWTPPAAVFLSPNPLSLLAEQKHSSFFGLLHQAHCIAWHK